MNAGSAGYAAGPALVPSGRARWSCGRELIWSLVEPCLGAIRRCARTRTAGDDLAVGQARQGRPGNLVLLRGELVARACGARAGGLADGQQLAAGPLREGLHADRSEHVIRSAQLRPRLGPPVLATQPLAVQQVRAGEFDTKAGSAQPIERLTITGLGVLAVPEQGPAAGIDSLPQSVWPTLGPRTARSARRRPARSARSCWPPRSAQPLPT